MSVISTKAHDDPTRTDLLVHNVSHTDFFVALSVPKEVQFANPDGANPPPFARPNFSYFEPVSKAVLAHLAKDSECRVISHPSEHGGDYPVGISFGMGSTH